MASPRAGHRGRAPPRQNEPVFAKHAPLLPLRAAVLHGADTMGCSRRLKRCGTNSEETENRELLRHADVDRDTVAAHFDGPLVSSAGEIVGDTLTRLVRPDNNGAPLPERVLVDS